METPTMKRVVYSNTSAVASTVIAVLDALLASRYVEVTPLPFGQFEIATKDEGATIPTPEIPDDVGREIGDDILSRCARPKRADNPTDVETYFDTIERWF